METSSVHVWLGKLLFPIDQIKIISPCTEKACGFFFSVGSSNGLLLLMSKVFRIIQTMVKVFLVFSKLALIRVWLDLHIGKFQIRLAQTVDTLGNLKVAVRVVCK